MNKGLNPCFSGWLIPSEAAPLFQRYIQSVSILVLVDGSFRVIGRLHNFRPATVSILVLVDGSFRVLKTRKALGMLDFLKTSPCESEIAICRKVLKTYNSESDSVLLQ